MPFVKKWITDKIRYRLASKGLDADGYELRTDLGQSDTKYAGDLGYYAKFTEIYKDNKGQPFDHVTLADTGEFYKTFDVEVTQDDIYITADFIKPEGHIGRNFADSYGDAQEFEEAIAALSDAEFDELLLFIKPYLITDIRNDLGL